MNPIQSSAFSQAAFRSLVRLGIVFLLACNLFADPLPLPDTVQFAETAKLPVGVKDRTLLCSIISENDNVLVVETSSVPGLNSRISIDKLLIAQIKRGDPSERPFAEISPELALPPESLEALYYDDKIDRIFEPFLKKYPQSPHAGEVQNAEKAYKDESQRVASGEFRSGSQWTQKSLLNPIDLKAIQLIQQARQSGTGLSLEEFKTLVEESRKCSASELFPVLGPVLNQISEARTAKLKAAADPNAKASDTEGHVQEEIVALQPISEWNWDSLKKAVDLVWQAENLLKTKPPEQITISIDLLLQSRQLMPSLFARDRILREQSSVYSRKAIETAKADDRKSSEAWWHGALLLANQLPPPENQGLSDTLLSSFEKAFTEQAAVLVEKRKYEEAKAWFADIEEFMAKTPAAASRMSDVKKRQGDFKNFVKNQVNQQTIDNLRKRLSEDLVKNDFEDAKIALSNQWDEISNLRPSAEETGALAHAALDQAAAAFKSLQPVSACQLIVIAHRISPEDPKVKTWVLATSLGALALFLIILFPLFWIFARSGIILENLRYRFRLKSLRKASAKKAPSKRRK